MEGIKLTNFTKSKEIRSFLERQFSKEFNMIVNGKSITAVKSMNLISLVANTFKDYPSFRMYFTGYTNDEKEAIAYLMSTLDMNSPNSIRTKIASSLSTEELKDFILGVFDIPYVDDNDDVKLIGDWVVTLIEVTPSEKTTEFVLTTETNDNEFSIFFLNGKFSHSYDENGNDSNINEETFPLLITECEKWSRELLGIVEEIVEDKRKKLTKSKFGGLKVSLPSNIMDWLKGNGYHCLDDAKKVARWYNKLTGGRNFVGGTSIGKSPQTLILDITSNSSDIYINGYEGGIDVCGVEGVETYKEFCDAIATKYIIG